MSFIAESLSRRLGTGARAVLTSNNAAARTFTTYVAAQRSATDAVKDSLHKVDRAVSDKLVDGIDVGTTVAEKVKEVTGDVLGSRTARRADEVVDKAAGRAKGAAADAAGKVRDVAGDAQKKL